MNTNNYFEDIKKVKKEQPEEENVSSETITDKKGTKRSFNWTWIICVLIALILISVALYIGYYIGKNKGINIGYYQAQTSEKKNQEDGTQEAAAVSSQPKKIEKTHKVQPGDTLFAIGLKYNIEWTKIAEYNGLSETAVIKEGDVVKIPQEGKETNEKTYTIDESVFQKYQSNVNDGLEQWRLNPAEVCKSMIPDDFEITKSDIYTLTNQNTESGEATVEITHTGQIYTATLIQPITKGEKGIWAVKKVTNQ
jgi:LysM repeat protein